MDAQKRLLDEFYARRAQEEPSHDPEADVRFRKAIRLATRFMASPRILDVGAKRGGFAAAALDGGFKIKYVGIDLSEENVAFAREHGVEMHHGDVAERLPFESSSFDIVICLEVLEHVLTPIQLLSEIHRVLIPEGRAILSVPNPYSWVELFRELFNRHDPEGHVNAYTGPVMANALALAGMKVIERKGTSLRVPATKRLIRTNSILARSRLYVVAPASEVVFSGRRFESPCK